jgi:sugar phosphate isomerase/epimerase
MTIGGVRFPSDPNQVTWDRFFDEVAEGDYKWTEVGPLGDLPQDPAFWPTIGSEVHSVGRVLQQLGAPFSLPIELSQGAVDFGAFRDVLDKVNYHGWAIVEQDMYPCPVDMPLPVAKRTRQYLKKIGIG